MIKIRPHQRAADHESVTAQDKIILADTYADLNPAAVQREIQALTDRLLKITTSKAKPATRPSARILTRVAGTFHGAREHAKSISER